MEESRLYREVSLKLHKSDKEAIPERMAIRVLVILD
jgi:hypothetical protein